MRSVLAGLRSLVLPWGAPATGPRTVLGPYVPPELAAFYALQSLDVTDAILHYTSANDYYYEANLQQFGTLTLHGFGFSDSTNVSEWQQVWRDTSDGSIFQAVGWQNEYAAIIGDTARGPYTGADFFRVEDPVRFEVAGTAAWFADPPRVGSFNPASSIPVHYGQSDTISVSMGPATSWTRAVNFPITFPAAPRVFANINSGAGATASWNVRVINITTTGCTIFGFGPSSTWTNIPVAWCALAQ